MAKISFSMYGTGYRANILLKVALALPEVFEVKYVIEGDLERAAGAVEKWGIPVIASVGDVDKAELGDFVVVVRSWPKMPIIMKELNELGIYVLAETFEFETPELLAGFYESIKYPNLIQTAEQYIYQPMNEARLRLIADGAIGNVTQAQISAGHGYHGTSLIRHYLNAGFKNATIFAKDVSFPIVKGPGRVGYGTQEEIGMDNQTHAILRFGDCFATFDFTGEQYSSQIRSSRVVIRGERGEIIDESVNALVDYKTPVSYDLKRYISGMAPHVGKIHTENISAGAKVYYTNPYRTVSLLEDEQAIAMMLKRMGEYTKGGEPCYSFEEGCQDQYLSIMMKQSMKTNQEVAMTTQVWAK
ncbi:MAG: hypothetical protein R3Y47_10630 [Lachnospiraceae bacterium]